MIVTDDIRRVLSCRSVRDKIGIARHQELCPVGDLPIISMLVREGYVVWIDRGPLNMVAKLESGAVIPVEADIYLLTPKGVAFCDEHGIKPR
jgi:hypothetical protein